MCCALGHSVTAFVFISILLTFPPVEARLRAGRCFCFRYPYSIHYSLLNCLVNKHYPSPILQMQKLWKRTGKMCSLVP